MDRPRRSTAGITATRSALQVVLALLWPAVVSATDLRLNEVVSRNQTGLTDEFGGHPDWIELHNPGDRPLDLAGWSLSDDAGRPGKWTFRSGSILPDGHVVVFASGLDRQPASAPPRTPGELPGLVTWLRADRLRTTDPNQIRQSGADAFVRRWRDDSGHGNDARQDQAGLQPRFVDTPTPAVRFDGLDDLLRLGRVPASNDFTVVAVVRPVRTHEIDDPSTAGVGGVGGQRWLFGAAHGGDRGAGAGLSVGTNGASLYEHGSGYMPALLVQASAWGDRFGVVTFAYSNRVPSLAVHGLPPSSGTASSRNPVTAPTELGSGAYGAFPGDVAEILIYARALEFGERRGLEEHLAARYGLSLDTTFHTNFRIDGDGERLVLTGPDGRRRDEVRIPTLPRDVAWGRLGDDDLGYAFFAVPTPGGANPATGARWFLSPPAFSRPAGFSTNAFLLSLSSPDKGVTLRYTLDGSDPTDRSPVYREPIPVSNRATAPNRLSLVPTAPGWQPPSGPVFKGTVVRARSFREDAIPSEIVTASYFVHDRGRARYSLPVVSLATDERHFFDPDTGIYVPGHAPGGNYSQSGDAWERPVHVEFFETDGARVLAQDSGVRMHGNTSFGFPIKALRLHPENQRGTGPFRHRIFPDLPVETFHRLLLRPSGHDHHLTMMRDGLMQGLVRELGIDTQGYRPAIVFLNGEYWGIHNLQEALEKHYFPAHHAGVDADAVDYLEGYSPGAFAYEGDASWYDDLVRRLERNPAVEPATYEWVGSRMELGNFRDYKLAEMFYYRWDIGNHRLWRPRTPDGRLRWILFDCDVGFGGFWSEPNPWTFDMLRAVLEPSGTLHGHNNATTVFLLQSLLRNPAFRSDFISRAADLMNGTLGTPRMLDAIDRLSGGIAPEMPEHIARWRAPATLLDWRRNVEALRTFARERPDHVRRHLMERFGLSGTVTLAIRGPLPAGCRVRVNSLELDSVPNTPWQGIYFRNHPIRLEAVPGPGWRFVGWTGLPGFVQPVVQVSLVADSEFAAGFEPEDAPAFGPVRRTDGVLAVEVRATPATPLVIETSADLRHWQELGAVTTDASGHATWTTPTDNRARFLRLRTTP